MILVINGSPRIKGNLHRMLVKVAEDTGEDYELIHLAKLRISPCRGCAKCAPTNRCVFSDGMAPLYEKIAAADAMIFGAVVYFGQPNAFTHTFLERMFPLRHRMPLTKNKPAAVVCVGAEDPESAASLISYRLKRFFNFNLVGSGIFKSYTPPCFICGFGTSCRYGRPAKWMNSEEFENFNEITQDMFQRFEDHPEVVESCKQLSQKIKVEIDFLRP